MAVIGAIEAKFPGAIRQRCAVHKVENILVHVPKSKQADVRNELNRIFYLANSKDEAQQEVEAFVLKWEPVISEAVECLRRDLGDCLRFYDFPKQHWRSIRTNNYVERLFGEVKKRARSMGAFHNEKTGGYPYPPKAFYTTFDKSPSGEGRFPYLPRHKILTSPLMAAMESRHYGERIFTLVAAEFYSAAISCAERQLGSGEGLSPIASDQILGGLMPQTHAIDGTARAPGRVMVKAVICANVYETVVQIANGVARVQKECVRNSLNLHFRWYSSLHCQVFQHDRPVYFSKLT
nr:transposase [Chloroflexota bacterium]